MKRLLVVGQAPSRAMAPGDRPFEGTRALTLLAKYSGVSPKERIYEIADVDNIIDVYPGPQIGNEKYDAFPLGAAKRGAMRVWKRIYDGRYDDVVVLGRKGSVVMGFNQKAEWFTTRTFEIIMDTPGLSVDSCLTTVWNCPHPGGTSMWWNVRPNQLRGQAFLSKMFAKHGGERSVTEVLAQPLSDRRIEMF